MRPPLALIPALLIAPLLTACSATGSSSGGGSARLTIEGEAYDVAGVSMTIEPGEDAWFRIEGDSTAGPEEECVPGLASGLGLYGDLPSSVTGPSDLVGKRLKVDFTGDGDDASFCFVGVGGLAGAEDAWVAIESVRGDRIAFKMTGTFKIYDEKGDGPIRTVSATGTAVLKQDS